MVLQPSRQAAALPKRLITCVVPVFTSQLRAHRSRVVRSSNVWSVSFLKDSQYLTPRRTSAFILPHFPLPSPQNLITCHPSTTRPHSDLNSREHYDRRTALDANTIAIPENTSHGPSDHLTTARPPSARCSSSATLCPEFRSSLTHHTCRKQYTQSVTLTTTVTRTRHDRRHRTITQTPTRAHARSSTKQAHWPHGVIELPTSNAPRPCIAGADSRRAFDLCAC